MGPLLDPVLDAGAGAVLTAGDGGIGVGLFTVVLSTMLLVLGLLEVVLLLIIFLLLLLLLLVLFVLFEPVLSSHT